MAEFSAFLDEKISMSTEGVVLKVLEEFDVPPAKEKVSPTGACPSPLSQLRPVRWGRGCRTARSAAVGRAGARAACLHVALSPCQPSVEAGRDLGRRGKANPVA